MIYQPAHNLKKSNEIKHLKNKNSAILRQQVQNQLHNGPAPVKNQP
jgi:hypothetical protein